MRLQPRNDLPLPNELVDAIIDLLHDDHAALTTCALVCRSWVTASRRHLFSQFIIDNKNGSQASDLLSSATCTIALAVRHLTLDRGDLIGLHDVIQKLSRIRQLSLDTLSMCGEWFPYVLDLVKSLHNLEFLALLSIRFPTYNHLLSLLHRNPQLRSVTCNGVLLGSVASAYTGHTSPLPPTVQNGLTSELNSAGVLNVPGRLTTLDMELYQYDGLMEGLLRDVGPTLQVLRLRSGPYDFCESPCTPPSLVLTSLRFSWAAIVQRFALLTQLRSLSFYYSPWTLRSETGFRFMVQALRHLTSPHLEELIIALPSSGCTRVNPDLWSELASLVEIPQTPSLSALRTLAFHFADRWHWVIFYGVSALWIEERFPLCLARGILRVEARDGRAYGDRFEPF
jgi:hypothetical protein